MEMLLIKVIEPLSVLVALLGVLVTAVAAIGSGAFKRLEFGPLKIEGVPQETAKAKELVAALRGQNREDEQIPFETEQLASYYSQVLTQSKTSFWFSLVFASLGFLVIIAAALMYSQDRQGSTVASFTAGVIIDAVAALFFVQSKNAQRAMGEFFDKLRNDRLKTESRTMCESIQDHHAKDYLRVQLALYYSGLEDHKTIAAGIFEFRQKILENDTPAC